MAESPAAELIFLALADFLAQWTNTKPPALEADVAALKSVIGVRMPEDYREVLLALNGGYISAAL
ncbi:MAG TPA: SMI1/KNR4 family protein [Prosthecobacter sp.]